MTRIISGDDNQQNNTASKPQASESKPSEDTKPSEDDQPSEDKKPSEDPKPSNDTKYSGTKLPESSAQALPLTLIVPYCFSMLFL